MGLSLARKWARTIFRSRPARPQPRRPRGRTRLLLECLEDRTLPSTVTWINPGGGDWDTASNWQDTSTGQNRLPTAADDAVISQSGITVTHSSFFNNDSVHSLTSAADLNISAGSLTLAAPSTINSLTLSGSFTTLTASGALEVQSLNQSGGTLTGAGTLTVDSSLVWTGGTMSGTGSTEVEGTGEVGGGSPFGPTLSGRTLDNFGTFTVDSGSNLLFASSATFNNQSGGTLALQGTAGLGNFFGSSGKLSNAGTLTHSGASTTSTVDVAFDNTGTVDVQSGTLSASQGLTNEGSLVLEPGALATVSGGSSSGDFNLKAGSHLSLAGTFTLQNGATAEVASGSQFELDGTTTQQGGATVSLAAGSTLNVGAGFNSGNYILNDGAAVTGPGLVELGGFSPQITVNGSASIDNLALSTGTVTGPGTLNVNSSLLWTGGTMSGTGRTEVNGTGEIGGGFSGPTLSGRTLDNFGTTTVDSGATLNFGSNATFNNQSGGTLALQGNAALGSFFGNSGKLSNAGTLTHSGANTTATVDVAFDNTGTVDVQSGTLSAPVGLTNEGGFTLEPGALATVTGGSSSGDFNLQAGSHLSIGGTFTLQSTATTEVASGAQFELDGIVTQQGGASVTAAAGGVVNVGPNFSFGGQNYILAGGASVSGPGIVELTGGSSLLTANGAASIDNLAVSNGTVTGPGTLTVNSSLLWTGGTISGTGSTEVEGKGEVGGGSPFGPTLSAHTLDNFGTFTIDNGSNLLFANNATLNNQSGGTLALQGTAQLGNFFGQSGKLSNAGTLTHSGANTTATVNVAFDNTGKVVVQSGTLNAAQGLTNEGNLVLDAGALATVGGGNSSGHIGLRAGSHLTVNGTFTLLAGSVTHAGQGSQLELDGTVTQQGGAAVRLASGSVLNVGPNFSFGGQNYTLADGAAVTGKGTVELTGFSSQMTANGAASVSNLSVSNGTVTVNSGDNLEVKNLTQSGGTITGPGTLTLDTQWTWTGGTMSGTGHTVVNGKATIGNNPFGTTLSGRTVDNNGTVTLPAGAAVAFQSNAVWNNDAGGTLVLNNGSSLGNFFGSSGTLNNAGLIEDTGPTSQATIGLSSTVTNSGTISLQGILNVSGSYVQTSAGTLTIVLSPGSPVANGELKVSGHATLDGTLNVITQGGASPTSGEAFTVMTYNSVTGDFASFTGIPFTPSRNSTSYTVTAS